MQSSMFYPYVFYVFHVFHYYYTYTRRIENVICEKRI